MVAHTDLQTASSASAAVSTACPLPSLCFRLEVPDAALASATGNILLQISGPTTYRYPDITLAHHNEKRHDYFRVVPHAGSSDVTVDRIVVNSSPNQVNCTGTVERLPSSSVKDRKVTADIRCIKTLAISLGSPADTDRLNLRLEERRLHGSIRPCQDLGLDLSRH